MDPHRDLPALTLDDLRPSDAHSRPSFGEAQHEASFLDQWLAKRRAAQEAADSHDDDASTDSEEGV